MWYIYIYTRYIYINTYIRYIHIVYIVITMHNVVHAHIVCVCEVLHVSMCVYNIYIYIYIYIYLYMRVYLYLLYLSPSSPRISGTVPSNEANSACSSSAAVWPPEMQMD